MTTGNDQRLRTSAKPWGGLIGALPTVRRRAVCGWLLLGCVFAGNVLSAAPPAPPRRHALLVGCTRYDQLPQYQQLIGPGNDVVLMKSVLMEVAGFSAEDIVVLSEAGETPQLRPTRANIVRCFEQLVKEVQPGEFVFVHLSGHGSRQADDDPDNPDDVEPDGKDEVFCPADVKRISPGASGGIDNGIRDDEFREWLGAMVRAGADVFFVADTCHSGTLTRAGDDRVARTLPAESFESEIESGSRTVALLTERGGAADLSLAREQADGPGRLVALYAAQPFEIAFEASFPRGAASPLDAASSVDAVGAQRYGMLTYTLARQLRHGGESLTYRELARRILAEYLAAGVTSPCPFMEGTKIDRLVFAGSSQPPRQTYTLRREGERMAIDAGELHGLTVGSVLAVWPLTSDPSTQTPTGHVTIEQLAPLSSLVSPCAFGELAAVNELPMPAAARLVDIKIRGNALRVGIDLGDPKPGQVSDTADAKALRDQLRQLDSPMIEVVQDPRLADWTIQGRRETWFLVPRQLQATKVTDLDPVGSLPSFGPLPDQDRTRWLQTRLERIAKAQQLIQLAATSTARLESTARLSVNLVEYSDLSDQDGKLRDALSTRPSLSAGKLIGFDIVNRGSVTLDVCLVFVDSHFGIQQLFPATGMADNRIQPGTRFRTRRFRVDPKSTGLEHVIAIGVRGESFRLPTTFEFLDQPGIETDVETTRGNVSARTAERSLVDSMLHVLEPSTRQQESDQGESSLRPWTMKILSWQTTDDR